MKASSTIFALGTLLILSGAACPPRPAASASPMAEKRPTEQTSGAKELLFQDWAYEPYVRTVQCYRGDDPFSYPILYLGDDAKLQLEFDILQSEDMQPESFLIDFIACDHDWTPNGLLPLEFMEGFSSDEIYFDMRSQNTRIPYVHYKYTLPEEGSAFKRSGNYLVRLFRRGNESDLILTRRIVVADKKVAVEPHIGLARMATERQRIQRVEFDVLIPNAFPGIMDPRTDFHVTVLQNFRWDNAVTEMQPMFTTPEKLEYQLDAANNFEGGNEYRWVDLRSTRFRTQSIQSIEDEDTLVRFVLRPELPRTANNYFGRQDFNGNYAIEVQEYPNADYESDYVFVRFALRWEKPLAQEEVFLLGKFNDWRLDSENQLSYNAASSCYEGELFLKQGVYDYAFAARNRSTEVVSESRFEGSHASAENYYTILVYYKPIGARAAELVGLRHINFYER